MRENEVEKQFVEAVRAAGGRALKYGFSLFKTFAHRAGVLNYNPPALRV